MMSARIWRAAGLMSLAVLSGTASAAEASRTIALADAKAVALQAVTHFLLKTDLDKLSALMDPEFAVDDRGPGSGKKALAEMRGELERGGVSPSTHLSVREILFFTEKDVPKLKRRFRLKQDLWTEKEVPAHIGGGLGCCVVAKELREGKEVDDEVFVLVVKKRAGRYRIVFLANS